MGLIKNSRITTLSLSFTSHSLISFPLGEFSSLEENLPSLSSLLTLRSVATLHFPTSTLERLYSPKIQCQSTKLFLTWIFQSKRELSLTNFNYLSFPLSHFLSFSLSHSFSLFLSFSHSLHLHLIISPSSSFPFDSSSSLTFTFCSILFLVPNFNTFHSTSIAIISIRSKPQFFHSNLERKKWKKWKK